MNWRVYEQNIKNRIAEAEIELKELRKKVANCELRLQLANEEKEAFDKAFEEMAVRGDYMWDIRTSRRSAAIRINAH